jgi:hypothetical protein
MGNHTAHCYQQIQSFLITPYVVTHSLKHTGVRFSNVFVNLRIRIACKNLRIATIFVILELHLIRIVTDCVCEIVLQWRSVATMQMSSVVNIIHKRELL